MYIGTLVLNFVFVICFPSTWKIALEMNTWANILPTKANQKPGQNTPVLSLATCAAGFAIAAGTELTNGQAEVHIWYASA